MILSQIGLLSSDVFGGVPDGFRFISCTFPGQEIGLYSMVVSGCWIVLDFFTWDSEFLEVIDHETMDKSRACYMYQNDH